MAQPDVDDLVVELVVEVEGAGPDQGVLAPPSST